MSSSMARPKSRWKVAAITGAAMATLIPAAARATLTVNLSLSPLGAPGFGTPTAPQSLNYLTPDNTAPGVPIYVYATVSSTGPLSPSDFNGLDYLYYNVSNGTPGTTTGIPGTLTASPNSNFNGLGSQLGTALSAVTPASPGVVVGGSSLLNIAKPQAPDTTRWSNLPSDGTNVIVGTNSVSFLVETLTFHPSAFNPSSAGHPEHDNLHGCPVRDLLSVCSGQLV